MKNYLFCIMFAFIVLSCSTQKYMRNHRIYEKIYDCQGINIKSLNSNSTQLNYIKKQTKNLNDLVQLDYLDNFKYSKNNDAVYILEMNGIQGDYLFTIWNKNDTISYTNESGKLMQTKNRLFTKYMIQLVSEWNLPEIKKEEETNSNLLPDESVYATRIIICNGKYKIDCFRFKDFFDLKRDGMDFSE